MRKRALLGTVLGLMLGMVAAFGPNAAAATRTWYAGHTAPHQPLLFSIAEKRNGTQVFSPVFIDFTFTCPVSGDVIGAEFSFSGFEEPVVNGKFDLNLSDPLFQRFDWSGKLGDASATGHLDAGLPAYDGAGGLQDCASGDAKWHAKALLSQLTRPAGTVGRIVVSVTKSPDGSIHYQVSE
jgi:hypothetical protein